MLDDMWNVTEVDGASLWLTNIGQTLSVARTGASP
jgi:hypothetical protein